MRLLIDASGDARCVYTEGFDLHRLGQLSVRRGSHVEPDETGRWTADLSPVDGPILGPYSSRQQALEAELAWLEEHWLVYPG